MLNSHIKGNSACSYLMLVGPSHMHDNPYYVYRENTGLICMVCTKMFINSNNNVAFYNTPKARSLMKVELKTRTMPEGIQSHKLKNKQQSSKFTTHWSRWGVKCHVTNQKSETICMQHFTRKLNTEILLYFDHFQVCTYTHSDV